MAHPEAQPHDPIEEIYTDVFLARGSIKMNALMTITRNMVIVRQGQELTLVDPIRLNAQEESKLEQLGTVKRILRLGPFHGLDDPYYMERFNAELWAPGDSTAYPEPKPTRIYGPETELPFADARIFRFENVKQPECALLIERDGGLLVTCDAIQHYGDFSFNNLPAKLLMPLLGFRKTTLIGPIWLKLMTPEGESTEDDFKRLLELRFENLVAAHGTLRRGGARAGVEAAFQKAFGKSK